MPFCSVYLLETGERGPLLWLNCGTSADVQAEAAQFDGVSHGWDTPNPQMRKVKLLFPA